MTTGQVRRRPAFLITIDTEGDNLWEATDRIETRNAAFLPRFQALCEKYGFKPTWLTNYEMATDPVFVDFGRDVLRRGQGEIGMHLHAWNSPPIKPLTEDDHRHRPYLIEYPDSVMRDKIAFMTDLLEHTFGVKMLSHRAGRWAFDERYARMLVDFGYRVDCSVTPGVSWRNNPGVPRGAGGTDYTGFSSKPYRLDLEDISREGGSPLLEVPMSTKTSPLYARASWLYAIPVFRRLAHRHSPPVHWFRPRKGNTNAMLDMVEDVAGGEAEYLEFMLHSSELMPDGSPNFRTEADIESLYEDLETVFSAVQRHLLGMTLAEFEKRSGSVPGSESLFTHAF
jgi:hypothetical protein